MLYRILFSVKPQHESAIGLHIYPPFGTSLPSPSPSHLSRLIQSLGWYNPLGWYKAMKAKLTNMLRGKEGKNRYAKLNRDRWRGFMHI